VFDPPFAFRTALILQYVALIQQGAKSIL